MTWLQGLLAMVSPSHAPVMGVHLHDMCFGSTTTRPSTVGTRSKQPDDCFFPALRQPGMAGQLTAWPTLVLETSVSQSIPTM
jgi:hypothetical protein